MLGPEQITKEALHVVNDAFLGLLTTVDAGACRTRAGWARR